MPRPIASFDEEALRDNLRKLVRTTAQNTLSGFLEEEEEEEEAMT